MEGMVGVGSMIWWLMFESDRWVMNGLIYGNRLIVMINSQSLSLSQKTKLWQDHKEDKFKQMAGDKCAIFNYFYNNNDIFKYIEDTDFNIYSLYLYKTMDIQSNIFMASLATVLLVDKLILNRFFPAIRFKELRATAFAIKYVAWPVALFRLGDYYFLKPYREDMFNIQEKYSFGFDQYIKANRIFERALAANRLEELMEKRESFDWSNVPELK